MKPVLAITLGDPAGISPEIVVKCLVPALALCRPLIFGHRASFERALHNACVTAKVAYVVQPVVPDKGVVAFVDCGPDSGPIDTPSDAAAAAQYQALARAVDAVLAGLCMGLVTAPVSKELIARLHPGFHGHTEYLAERAGLASDDVTMIFAAKDLVVGLVSTHLPLREVADALTPARLERTARHVLDVALRLVERRPLRLGVSALNPHAGEGGLLGDEEQRILAPFCERLRRDTRLVVNGPTPAETLFREALRGGYDAVVAAYHDQAMIPLKLHGLGTTVNVTAGLPFVRTSPDHGVAYNLARTGMADAAPMLSAIALAARLVTDAPLPLAGEK